jgi:hypothetical protein
MQVYGVLRFSGTAPDRHCSHYVFSPRNRKDQRRVPRPVGRSLSAARSRPKVSRRVSALCESKRDPVQQR